MKKGRLANTAWAVRSDGNGPAAQKPRAVIDCILLHGVASLLYKAEEGGVFMNMELGCGLGKVIPVGSLCGEAVSSSAH